MTAGQPYLLPSQTLTYRRSGPEIGFSTSLKFFFKFVFFVFFCFLCGPLLKSLICYTIVSVLCLAFGP